MKKIKKPLWYRVLRKIENSNERVFLNKDFERICKDDRQVRRALNQLTQKGHLAHIGRGIYSKAKFSSLTGKVIPVAALQDLGRETAEKLGLDIILSDMEKGYALGKHNQISTGRTLLVQQRCSRVLSFENQRIEIHNPD